MNEEISMYETKADAMAGDPLAASFDLAATDAAVDDLRAQMAQLRARLDSAAVSAARPALAGALAAPEHKAFVEHYLRKGQDAGVELKSMSSASGEAGGYAVPREIDAAIGETLTAISPIRSIATVVKVGSAGYVLWAAVLCKAFGIAPPTG